MNPRWGKYDVLLHISEHQGYARGTLYVTNEAGCGNTGAGAHTRVTVSGFEHKKVVIYDQLGGTVGDDSLGQAFPADWLFGGDWKFVLDHPNHSGGPWLLRGHRGGFALSVNLTPGSSSLYHRSATADRHSGDGCRTSSASA